MRLWSYILLALALIAAGFAIFLYLAAMGMSCAYAVGTPDCGLRYPWELGRDDIIYLVLIPWSVVLLLTGCAITLHRRSR